MGSTGPLILAGALVVGLWLSPGCRTSDRITPDEAKATPAAGGSGQGTAGTAGETGAAGAAGAAGLPATPDAAVADATATDAITAAETGPRECAKGLAGPVMVRVLSPGGLAYCIDTTEVTWGQYAAFLKAKGGDTSGQPAECAWNDRYEPRTGDSKEVGGCAPLDYTHPTGYAEKPVECVDWCDALGYCTWAGKRLCGKVGGGTAPQNASTDPNVSEWYNACSQGGTTVYPYGNQISPDACNTDAATDAGCALDSSASCRKTTPVGSLTSCRGTKPPYDQIFDMVGNVMEWEDACQSSKCLIRGEAYQSPDARCASPGQTWMQSAAPGGGFRCCADPK